MIQAAAQANSKSTWLRAPATNPYGSRMNQILERNPCAWSAYTANLRPSSSQLSSRFQLMKIWVTSLAVWIVRATTGIRTDTHRPH